ncbi:alkaline phosphatase family protein [Romeria aff. gracilis LEGE 07310]|uniref:Alkaline phosphatase family protein n=1 Tax=Vasconcelosia minhoensis LEGE 07310 TaxID=915328 RepID=A0A8J7AC25_9CYAN|nr:nucleotide pyrophosphatase/phosphodiesterase family protein [Romeria gracilis]MBE9077531.1 alkaline phosphatase family protein [Romeria aff. gracilis LEGE 07310]
MQKTVVLNVVGLTDRLIGPHTPNLARWRAQGQQAAIAPQLPAVTCSTQATYLTGKPPRKHGIVGNGWYFRDDCEVKFWRQSNRLVQAPKLWEVARSLDPDFTCANLFWWYNMYSSVDYAVTPRPMYPADGRKLPDIYTQPAEMRDSLQAELGQFPLFKFWGPATAIDASQWIAESAQWIEARYAPTLTLIYLPHLDYGLQKVGCQPDQIAQDLRDVDAVCGDLIDYYEACGAQVVVLSEYGITPVSKPVHLNRLLREQGLLAVREELGRELLDAGASQAFAVADHQIAHVYISEAELLPKVRSLLQSVAGVAEVLDAEGKRRHQLDHPRAGDLVVIAEADAWFTYYYWLDDSRAPDFGRTVDIHRKPGYDPAELFIDPALKRPILKLGWTLLKQQLGFRYLMDVIPLDATLVRGSHGHLPKSSADWPLLITQTPELLPADRLEATAVFQVLLNHLQPASVNQPNAISAR